MTDPIELPDQADLIDGAAAAPGLTLDTPIEDPNTGAVLQQQMATDPAEVDRALASAWALHCSGDWQNTSPEERAGSLMALADELEGRAEEVARLEAATSGATIGTTMGLSFIVHAAFRLAAMQLTEGVLSTTFEGPAGSDVEVDRLGWGPRCVALPLERTGPHGCPQGCQRIGGGVPRDLEATRTRPPRHRGDRRGRRGRRPPGGPRAAGARRAHHRSGPHRRRTLPSGELHRRRRGRPVHRPPVC